MEHHDEAAAEAVREMDALFSRTNFAAENPGLKERLWQKIQTRLAWEREARAAATDRELAREELAELAAAGTPHPIGKLPGR